MKASELLSVFTPYVSGKRCFYEGGDDPPDTPTRYAQLLIYLQELEERVESLEMWRGGSEGK